MRRRRLGGWGPFLLLVFGWLLLAGGMNTARHVHSMLELQSRQAQAGNSVARTRAALQAQIARLTQPSSANSDPFEGELDDRFPGMEAMREFQARAMQDMNAMMARQLKAQLASLPASAPPSPPTLLEIWKGSSWSVQVGSVWSGSLAALSLVGLLAVAAAAWRGWPDVRPLVFAASILFACYGGWHIMLFINEMR